MMKEWMFSPNIGNKTRMCALTTSILHCTGGSSCAIRPKRKKKERKKRNKSWKRERNSIFFQIFKCENYHLQQQQSMKYLWVNLMKYVEELYAFNKTLMWTEEPYKWRDEMWPRPGRFITPNTLVISKLICSYKVTQINFWQSCCRTSEPETK